MDAKKISSDMRRRCDGARKLLRTDLPRIIAHQGVEHFTNNFRKGGFVDNGLQKWPDVKRRDETSPWYGFDYKGEKRTYYAFTRDKTSGKSRKASKQKSLNFSPAATTRKVLTSKRNLLMSSLRSRTAAGKAIVYTTAPHAQIHNEGGAFKVFGRHAATMPKRQFMGHSAELDATVEREITARLDRIFNH